MPRVVFMPNPLWPREAAGALTVEAKAGDALVDICDEMRAPIPFSCRAGSCGTCYVEVLEGATLLAPVGPDERDTLDMLEPDAPEEPHPTRRLACQATLGADEGLIRLRPYDRWRRRG